MTKKVAIYARVSTEAQDTEFKTSIEIQIADCENYANRNEWQIVDKFIDNRDYPVRNKHGRVKMVNSSGTRTDRPQFTAMLDLVKKGEIDVILCWRDDRLYRHEDVVHAINKAIEESEKDIEIHQCTGEITKDFMYIQAMVWRKETEARKQRSLAGKIGQIKRGYWPQIWNAYGYQLEKQSGGSVVVLDEREAKTVKLVYDLCDQGLSSYRIRDELIKRQIPQKRKGNKKLWCTTSILHILHNRVYLGKASLTLNGQTYSIEIPQIIELAQFNRVQNQLQLNKKHSPRNEKNVLLVKGLLYCEHCGTKLSASVRKHWYTRKGEKVPYKRLNVQYRCSNRFVPHDRKGWSNLDSRVWDFVANNLFTDEDLLNSYIDESTANFMTEQCNIDEELAKAKENKTKVEASRKVLFDSLRNGYMTESEFENEIRETKNRLDLWTIEIQRLEQLKEQRHEAKQARKYIIDLIGQMKENIKIINQPEEELNQLAPEQSQSIRLARQSIIRLLIERIEVYSDDSLRIMGGLFDSQFVMNTSKWLPWLKLTI